MERLNKQPQLALPLLRLLLLIKLMKIGCLKVANNLQQIMQMLSVNLVLLHLVQGHLLHLVKHQIWMHNQLTQHKQTV